MTGVAPLGRAAIVLGFFLLACSPQERNPSTSPTSDSSAPVGQAAGATALARRDVPPAAVHRQLDFRSIGNGPCPDPLGTPPSGPYLQVRPYGPFSTDTAQIGWPLDVCGYQFEPGAVVLQVLGPNGAVVHRDPVPTTQDNGLVRYLVEGIDPAVGPGRYTVRLSQGNHVATETIQYEWARQHRVSRRADDLSDEGMVWPGATLTIDLVGYPAGSEVETALYVEVGRSFQFATMLQPVTIDQNGTGTLRLQTAPTDSGCYSILPDPRGATPQSFVRGSSGNEPSVDQSFQDLGFCMVG